MPSGLTLTHLYHRAQLYCVVQMKCRGVFPECYSPWGTGTTLPTFWPEYEESSLSATKGNKTWGWGLFLPYNMSDEEYDKIPKNSYLSQFNWIPSKALPLLRFPGKERGLHSPGLQLISGRVSYFIYYMWGRAQGKWDIYLFPHDRWVVGPALPRSHIQGSSPVPLPTGSVLLCCPGEWRVCPPKCCSWWGARVAFQFFCPQCHFSYPPPTCGHMCEHKYGGWKLLLTVSR